MKSITVFAGILLIAALAAGCRDETPPPPRVAVPPPNYQSGYPRDRVVVSEREDSRPITSETPREDYARRSIPEDRDPEKPLPPQAPDDRFRPPFDDVPLVNQQPPEQPAFVQAYRRVGSPRVALFVNRSLDGKIIPVNPNEPIVRAEVRGHVSGNVDVRDRHGNSVKSNGPVDYNESSSVYLPRGQYDEVQAKSLDYEALENIMTDWLAANGQVQIISPTMARQRLSDKEVKELQEGRPQALSEVAQQLGCDVLIQVQAHPTRQTSEGLEVRIIAEAFNTRGGQSIGRAVVDVPPPLEKTTLNRFTRFLARKLMMDMTETWNSPPPPEMQAPESAPPTTQRQ